MPFLNETTNEILCDFIVSCLKDNCSKNGKKECEIRFGHYSSKEFVAEIEPEFFYRFQNILKKISKSYKSVTIDEIYELNNTSFKRVIKETNDGKDDKEYYMTKKSIRKYNVYDYDLRFSLSQENYIKKPDMKNAELKLIRKKERSSFYFKTPVNNINLRYDFTIVSQNDKKIFELEVELIVNDEFKIEENNIKKDEMIKTLMEHVDKAILNIIKTRQKNFINISNTEKKLVLSLYKDLTQNYYFIGAQPETLHKEQLSLLNNNYAVTDKIDGDRQFLFIDKNSNCYFLDNNFKNIRKTNLKIKNYTNCLIDGELLCKEKTISFYAFDILFFNGTDLRGHKEFDLHKRYKLLSDIERNILNTELYNYKVKTYVFGNVFLGSRKLYERKDLRYNLDGLVFVPIGEPYPKTKKWTNLLKWKPSEMTTIDFWTIKSNDNTNLWKLYVQKNNQSVQNNVQNIKKSKSQNDSQPVLFDIKHLLGEHSEFSTFETIIDDQLLDKTTNQPFLSETVIEFMFDKTKKQFIPIRTRWDKTHDSKKHGNYYTVACDIWKSIWNPISFEYLVNYHYNPVNQVSNSYNQTTQAIQFYTNMRQYHNKIKQYLYNTYCNNIDFLVEFCSGKGGDLHKWYHNKIKRVDGYDNHQPSINEAYKRLKQINEQYSTQLNYHFYLADLSNMELELKQNFDYDVVSCQFGLHYFYDSENTISNVIKTISSLLKTNGIFIGTILDDNLVNALLNNNTTYEHKMESEIIFSMEKKTQSSFSDKISIYLSGDNYLTNASHEYLIRFEHLVNLCKIYDLELIDTSTFGKVSNNKLLDVYNTLFSYEKIVSNLFRYFAFRKITKVSNIEFNCNLNYEKSIRNKYNNQELSVVDLNWWVNGTRLITIPSLQLCAQMLNMKNVIYNPFKYSNMECEDLDYFLTEFKHTNFIYIDDFEKQFMDKEISQYQIHFSSLINPTFVVLVKTKHIFTITDPETQEQVDVEKTVFGFLSYNDKFLFQSEDEALGFLIQAKQVEQIKQTEQTEQEVERTEQAEKQIDNIELINPDYSKMTINELKTVLKRHNQKTSGNKKELIKRLSILELN